VPAQPAESLASTPGQILHVVFGYSRFRGPQAQIVEHVTAGGGKSLCYQIPAIARKRAGRGIAVVVSPLFALMHNKVGALHEAGVSAAFLNSSLDWQETQEVERRMLRGDFTLLFAAPERVTTPRFVQQLDALHQRDQLALFAIDEAHCVSQWGHDFRPEYRALTVLHERYASVPRVALTATADRSRAATSWSGCNWARRGSSSPASTGWTSDTGAAGRPRCRSPDGRRSRRVPTDADRYAAPQSCGRLHARTRDSR
jgi:ATP-dependent DNA helicase RecQ